MLGLLMEELDGERKLGLGYLLRRDCWGMGYATEGAQALLDEAFYKRNASEVIAEIRPETYLPAVWQSGWGCGRKAS